MVDTQLDLAATPRHQWGDGTLRRLITWIILAAGAVTLSVGWAASSPVGASPDEDAHIVYAWGVATGQTLPHRTQLQPNPGGAALTIVQVPQQIRDRQEETCYAFQPSKPACGDEAGEFQKGITPATTYMTRYPPLYYAFVGGVLRVLVAIGAQGPLTLLVARVASSLLSMLLVGCSTFSLSRRFGRAPACTAAAAITTPTLLFLSASVNPNGFEIASAFATAAFVACIFFDVRRLGHATRESGTGLVITSLCLGMARPASVAWLIAILLLLLLPVNGRMLIRQLRLVTQIGIVLSTAIGLFFFAYINMLREGGITDHDLYQWNAFSPAVKLTLVILKFGDLVINGYGLLGWTDTAVPQLFFVLWLMCVSATFGYLMHRRSTAPVLKARWALLVLVLCCSALMVQSYLAAFGWQGRYFAPCLAAFAALLVPSMESSAPAPTRTRQAATIALVTAAVLNTGALLWNLGRYLYGLTALYVRFDPIPIPNATGTWEPLFGRFMPFFIGTLGMACLVFITLSFLWNGARTTTHSPSPDPGQSTKSTGDSEQPMRTSPSARTASDRS